MLLGVVVGGMRTGRPKDWSQMCQIVHTGAGATLRETTIDCLMVPENHADCRASSALLDEHRCDLHSSLGPQRHWFHDLLPSTDDFNAPQHLQINGFIETHKRKGSALK